MRNQSLTRRRTGIRIVLGGAGFACLLLGLAQGDYGRVLEKAVRICLECVGLG